ncbi:MAG: hypothetical protein AAGH83_03870 [Pseudomonadota bacterium]
MSQTADTPRIFGLAPGVFLQCAALGLLIAGALLDQAALKHAAAFLVVLWIATQWPRLLPQSRWISAAAAISVVLSLAVFAGAFPRIVTAIVQGTGFAALMMVLGLLRQPVKRARVTHQAAEYLLSFRPRRRFAALQTGAQFMALMFNVGIVAMIGDLTEARDGRDVRRDPGRRAMILATMRGNGLMATWAPVSLGFAVVSTGLTELNPDRLIAISFVFVMVTLAITGRWPLLPPEARMPEAEETPAQREPGGPGALIKVLCVSAVLLAATIVFHDLIGLNFNLTTVIVIPVFALTWLALEPARIAGPFRHRLTSALGSLGDLRSESALFMSASILGTVLTLAIQASPLWPVISGPKTAALPALLAVYFLIPFCAFLYVPNLVTVVMAAQVLAPTALGQNHPTALGLALCIGWGASITANPISAFSMITGRLCDVPTRKLAHGWNMPYTLMLLALGVGPVCVLYWIGG